jgi:hypothetical protein
MAFPRGRRAGRQERGVENPGAGCFRCMPRTLSCNALQPGAWHCTQRISLQQIAHWYAGKVQYCNVERGWRARLKDQSLALAPLGPHGPMAFPKPLRTTTWTQDQGTITQKAWSSWSRLLVHLARHVRQLPEFPDVMLTDWGQEGEREDQEPGYEPAKAEWGTSTVTREGKQKRSHHELATSGPQSP